MIFAHIGQWNCVMDVEYAFGNLRWIHCIPVIFTMLTGKVAIVGLTNCCALRLCGLWVAYALAPQMSYDPDITFSPAAFFRVWRERCHFVRNAFFRCQGI